LGVLRRFEIERRRTLGEIWDNLVNANRPHPESKNIVAYLIEDGKLFTIRSGECPAIDSLASDRIRRTRGFWMRIHDIAAESR
jgi:hypothetical protein